MVWGKLLGGAFGFMIGGPIGAVLGAALGHSFDKGMDLQLTHDAADEDLEPGDADRIKMAFFTATFSVMGHIAKADGHIHPSEIALAEALMKSMKLDAELRSAAINLFNQGKQDSFDAEALVLQFRQECQRRTSLYRMFVEIQIQAALADGEMSPDEEKSFAEDRSCSGFLRIHLQAAGNAGSLQHGCWKRVRISWPVRNTGGRRWARAASGIGLLSTLDSRCLQGAGC